MPMNVSCNLYVRQRADRSSASQAEARLDPDRVAESLSADAGKVPCDLELIGTSDAGLEAADRLLAWLTRGRSAHDRGPTDGQSMSAGSRRSLRVGIRSSCSKPGGVAVT